MSVALFAAWGALVPARPSAGQTVYGGENQPGRSVTRRGVVVGAPAPRPSPSPRVAAMAGIAVATVTWTDAAVEREASKGKAGWQKLHAGDSLRTGDRLRTSAEGVARIEFPWMAVTAGPATILHIPAEVVLSTVLSQGRAEFEAHGRDIVKVRTADAEIRGAGRMVVRRERERTIVMVMALDGVFSVEANGDTVLLQAGEGTIVRDGDKPGPAQKLPAPPNRVRPTGDALYVPMGNPVSLSWDPTAPAFHVQVMALGSSDVLIARDVLRPPYLLSIPWEGTYRWRVSSRDAQGLEGRPSEEGLLCVVEK